MASENTDSTQEYAPTGNDERLAERLAAITDDDAEARAAALRAGLDDYELEDDDAALLSPHEEDQHELPHPPTPPVLAIIGRPNVGKSTWSTGSSAPARPWWKTCPG